METSAYFARPVSFLAIMDAGRFYLACPRGWRGCEDGCRKGVATRGKNGRRIVAKAVDEFDEWRCTGAIVLLGVIMRLTFLLVP